MFFRELADIKITDIILEFIYPCRCIMCGQITQIQSEIKICRVCSETVEKNRPPFCTKCGRHTDMQTGLCQSCSSTDFSFDAGGALWPYEGKMARAVLDLKFNRRLENGKTLGLLCAQDIIEKKLAESIDVIVPVPLNKRKMHKRGFNQAEIIAETIGGQLNIPVDGSLLSRIRDTAPQMELNHDERLKNVGGSMKAAPKEKIAGRSVLLIDDIFTTGSTAEECARALKKNGAGIVNCFFVCISYGKAGTGNYI